MKPWVNAWENLLGLSSDLSEGWVAIIALLFAYFLVIIPTALLVAHLERKMAADFQARVGPSRAGPAGFFQPMADLLKLLQKDSGGDRRRGEDLWFLILTMSLFSTVAVLPLGTLSLLVDTDLSALLPFWAALVLALGTMLLGLNQGSVPGWAGALRVASRASLRPPTLVVVR